ncbi:MAG: single-stranded-DNA-specific exonuclease RecJ [Pyrinomonadaceae bacterium]|nr:single-stranded-DNA-specific exonuclease RecJ [Pyrinomonadaceae bacterium]
MKRWTLKEVDQTEIKKLSETINVSPLIARLLIARGYDTEEKALKFLNPKYEDLHEPNLLKGMETAVARILKAIDAKEKILIWGDYDVDGTTGTVVLRKALEILGGETGFHVPHRFKEGYGINIPALEQAKKDGFTLVISVDCGITSFEPVAWAKENGIDFIVTDHHLAKEEGNPDAFAVVNPNQAGCEYPDKNLAGVGVAFKVAHALLRERGKEHLVPYFLKVVAIGTIADVMKLTGENRAIVAIGLADLPKAKNFGLKALMEVSDCREEMTSYHIGFRIAPRINAAGRMDAAKHVVDLLEADSYRRARELAEYLNNKNIERQKVQKDITELALLETKDLANNKFVVVTGKGWHRGVIGLAASRVAEKLHRPTIVISIDDEGMGHGSARSIANYHLLEGLDTCADVFEQYGGHAAAAGMKIQLENVDVLREKMNEHAANIFSAEDLIPEIKIDAEILSSELDLELVEALKQLEPFGMGNPKPVFVTDKLFLQGEPWIMKEKHLKLPLSDEEGRKFEAVWWDGVEKSAGQTLKPQTSIELAYTAEANTWQGNTRLQLVVRDLRITM